MSFMEADGLKKKSDEFVMHNFLNLRNHGTQFKF